MEPMSPQQERRVREQAQRDHQAQYDRLMRGALGQVARPTLQREVAPVLRIRLELLAFFVGIAALAFWFAYAW